MNFGRVTLSSLTKSKLKLMVSTINDFLNEQQDDFPFLQWYLVLLEIIETKLYKEKIIPKKDIKIKARLNVKYVNKAVDTINFSKILNSKSVKPKMPVVMNNDVPMVTYKLLEPVGQSFLIINLL